MSYKYLLVEDSSQIREALCDFFIDKSKGEITIDEASDGNTALLKISKTSYDLILLDIMLPGPSGFEICKEIRRRSICPVIFLTALEQEENMLKGYDLGADDYVTKPFSLKELYAKSLAVVKRYKGDILNKSFSIGKITIDPDKMQVYVDFKPVTLAPKEYFLLKTLMENEGRVFNREMLISRVWGIDFDGSDRVVDNHIKKLRKSLGTAGSQIVTVIGGGYKITK